MSIDAINKMYVDYQDEHKHVLDIETKLVNAKSEDEFLSLLNEKSKYFRDRYKANKESFDKLLYPFLNGEKELNNDIAYAFFKNASSLLFNEVVSFTHR